MSDQDFVTNLYGNALGRAPEPAGLAGWDDALAHGTSRASVAIAESQEAHQHLIAAIETGFHLF